MKSSSSDGLAARQVPSPFGELLLLADRDALVELRFLAGDRPAAPEAPAPHPILDLAARELAGYFRGDRSRFETPLAPRGTRFQHEVWSALAAIPFGERRSYGAIARAIGRPRASRAVGRANGDNPLPIFLPCHRVIGADGSLTGYGGGIEIKRWLLEHESPPA